jgi:hypothetical protein
MAFKDDLFAMINQVLTEPAPVPRRVLPRRGLPLREFLNGARRGGAPATPRAVRPLPAPRVPQR